MAPSGKNSSISTRRVVRLLWAIRRRCRPLSQPVGSGSGASTELEVIVRVRRSALVLAGAAACVASLAPPASAAKGKAPGAEPVTVVASGLNGPFGLGSHGRSLLVAEGFAGQVSSVDSRTGAVTPVLTGLPFPADVDRVGGELVFVTGGASDGPTAGSASVFVAKPGGEPRLLADLEAYELAENPDGQQQFDEAGQPLDALSNPFSVLAQRGSGYVLVADGGANAVLSVSRSGEVSTFFVPPLVTTGECAGLPNNDPEHVGCDSVPTGLAYGPGNTLYVATLSGGVPGEGLVYVLDARTGAVRDVIGGFNDPTGVAVAPDGTVYVSEVFGPSEGGPPGRIVRVDRDGTRTYASVPLTVGLEFQGGTLYATAWSLGDPGSGQIVSLQPSAFS